MQWLYAFVAISGAGYIVVARRRPDGFTVALFSAGIYFLPALVGYTLSPVTAASPIKLPVELEAEAIAIMTAVMLMILMAAVLWDRWERDRPPPAWVLEDAWLATWVALALGMIGVIATAIESGGVAFTAEKSEVVDVVGRGHLLWQMAATLGTVLAFTRGQRFAGVLGWLLLLLDMWIGFRYAFATAFIAVGILWLTRPEPFRLGGLRVRYWAVILAGGLFIVSYQNLKEPLRAGDWAEIGARVSSPMWYAKGVLTSEPFTTQTVLNEIVRKDFRTRTDHLWAAASHFIVFSPALGEEAVRFNQLYQPALFPLVDHGLANNIWAQMWSAGGWTLLILFSVIFVLCLAVGSRLLRSPDPAVRAYAAVAIAYWGFYLHRNELQGVVGSQKQLVLVWMACVAASIVIATVAKGGGIRPVGVGPDGR